MIKKSIRVKKPVSEINVTPFVDVMLVMLIIFMITTPVILKGMDIDVPKANAQSTNTKEHSVTISIDHNSNIFVDDQPILEKKLLSKINDVTKGDKNADILLKADKNLPYGTIMKILELIKLNEFHKVSLITKTSTN